MTFQFSCRCCLTQANDQNMESNHSCFSLVPFQVLCVHTIAGRSRNTSFLHEPWAAGWEWFSQHPIWGMDQYEAPQPFDFWRFSANNDHSWRLDLFPICFLDRTPPEITTQVLKKHEKTTFGQPRPIPLPGRRKEVSGCFALKSPVYGLTFSGISILIGAVKHILFFTILHTWGWLLGRYFSNGLKPWISKSFIKIPGRLLDWNLRTLER